MSVTETFFAVIVADMKRAIDFYVRALGAQVAAETVQWTSLRIAGVRVGLSLNKEHAGGHSGLHFAVENLNETLTAIESAGGKKTMKPTELAIGLVLAGAADTEGNEFTLRGP